MSEWWTYRPSDFLMFAPRTYYRLFELYNATIWPGQLLAIVAGLAIVALLLRPTPPRNRIVWALLAACWLWVAWGYFFTRYATINWAATYFAAAFAIEALFLVWVGVADGRLAFGTSGHRPIGVGFGLFLFALAVQPLIGPAFGRAWSEAEIFGIAPDPTAVATLGILLAADRMRWMLLVVPAVWCAISGATLWTMGSPDAFVPPLAALLALFLAARPARVKS